MEGSSQHTSLLSDLRAGTIVDGKYRVDEVIGRGGMGVVVGATHVHLNEPVALKFLDARTADGEPEDFRARFEREARVCARLRNEHVVRVIDVGVWRDRTPYMVMDRLVGRDLRRAMREMGRIPAAQAVDYAVQICEGLAEAHAQGIVHRDLKPPNIFLTKRHDGSDLVKVLDFGISKWVSEGETEQLTKAGTLLGSPKYMAPEQLSDAGVDARSDVWSIGALLFEMLTGRPPYDMPNVTQTFVAIASGTPPPSPRLFEPSLSPALEAVILGCLVHDKEQRIASVADLAGALLEAMGSPLADDVRARLRAVLDPAYVPPRRSIPTGRITLTTGSYSAVSITGPAPATGAHAQPIAIVDGGKPIAPRAGRARVKRWGVLGGALFGLLIVAMAAARGEGGGTSSAASAPSREIPAKQLEVERTSLASSPMPRAFAIAAAAARPIAPRAAREPRPAASSAPPPPAASVERPAPSPAPAPRASAAPKPVAVNPLDDRQ